MITRLQQELVEETAIEDIPEQYRDAASIAGIETYVRLADYAQGDELYFPKVDTLLIPARNRRICREYNGYNRKELSEKYGITTQQVSRILKSDRSIQHGSQQKDLEKPEHQTRNRLLPGQINFFEYLDRTESENIFPKNE